MEFSNPLLAYLAVFIAGLAASLSPCVLPVFPLIIASVGGYAEGDIRQSALFCFFFSLGLAVTFTVLGAIASIAGTLLGDIGGYWKYILSAAAIIMGLQVLDLIKIPIPTTGLLRIKQKGLLGAFILGIFFGIASSPCATPILAVILTYVASRHNVSYGISLLFVYALANTFMVFAVGISTAFARNLLNKSGFRSLSDYVRKFSGIVFIIAGIMLLLYK